MCRLKGQGQRSRVQEGVIKVKTSNKGEYQGRSEELNSCWRPKSFDDKWQGGHRRVHRQSAFRGQRPNEKQTGGM